MKSLLHVCIQKGEQFVMVNGHLGGFEEGIVAVSIKFVQALENQEMERLEPLLWELSALADELPPL